MQSEGLVLILSHDVCLERAQQRMCWSHGRSALNLTPTFYKKDGEASPVATVASRLVALATYPSELLGLIWLQTPTDFAKLHVRADARTQATDRLSAMSGGFCTILVCCNDRYLAAGRLPPRCL